MDAFSYLSVLLSIILGLAIKVIVGAVSRRRQPTGTGGAPPSQEVAAGGDKPAGHDG